MPGCDAWVAGARARVLVALVFVKPVILAGPSAFPGVGSGLRLVVVVAPPETDAQKDGDEDHDDNGGNADNEQDHRTTRLTKRP